MLPLYTQIGPWTIPTFRLTVGLAICFSLFLMVYRQPHRTRLIDRCIGALLVGIIGARVFHVALNWDYFADNPAEIWTVSAGGLDWHGAVWGGLLGLAFIGWLQNGWARWRKTALVPTPFNTLLVLLTPALPLIGLGGWVGCLAAGCGYGKEVDTLANFPAWMTSLLVDVFGIVAPRYNTPYFGMLLCGLGLVVALRAVFLRHQSPTTVANPRLFWALLAYLSAGMFVIGLYRADHTLMLDGLRGDQLLDVVMGLWSAVLLIRMWNTAGKESQ